MGDKRDGHYKETVSQSLANNAVGAGVDHSGALFKQVRGFVFADQNGTLAIEQSYDGATWRQTDTTVVVASTGKSLDGFVVRDHVRVSFKNTSGGAACTIVELDIGLYI